MVILGHPQKQSFCGTLAQAYAKGAEEAGNEVQQIYLGELEFDPVLWSGYHKIQALESDLVKAQQAIK